MRPWSLLAILNFSARWPTDITYFNVFSPSSSRDNKWNFYLRLSNTRSKSSCYYSEHNTCRQRHVSEHYLLTKASSRSAMKTPLCEQCPNTVFSGQNQSPEVFHKNLFLKFLLYPQENTWHFSWRSATLIKGDSNTYFTVNIAKFIKKPISKNICKRLLLFGPFLRSGLWELGNKHLKKWQYSGLNVLDNIPALCCELWTNLPFYVVLTCVNNVGLNKICCRT